MKSRKETEAVRVIRSPCTIEMTSKHVVALTTNY